MEVIINYTNQTEKFEKIKNIIISNHDFGQLFFDDLSAEHLDDLTDFCLFLRFENNETKTIYLNRCAIVIKKNKKINICNITSLEIFDI